MFAEIDADGNGVVDIGEMVRLGEILGETWDERQLATLFAEADTDADGSLDFKELYGWLARNVSLMGPDGTPRWSTPSSAALEGRTDAAFLELFPTMDLGLGHRADIIEGEKLGLENHLFSVRAILQQWGAPPACCTAGLFHSVYEVNID